ncbi:MAG TPA: hypothetical protein VFO53_12475 [Casimicrobiaceae bacterium]|nr:hypothetical protein [Casimicrobiaceae bacterium]
MRPRGFRPEPAGGQFVVAPDDLSGTPGWAKPIVAAALAADHA